jgi:hypothetical protein
MAEVLTSWDAQPASPAVPVMPSWDPTPSPAPAPAPGMTTLQRAAVDAEHWLSPTLNTLAATGEPLANVLTGAVAMPLAGLAGLGSLATGGNGSDTINRVMNALTYHPTTPMGQSATQTLTAPFRALQSAGNWAGDQAMKVRVIGGPALATAVDTGVQMAGPALVGRAAAAVPSVAEAIRPAKATSAPARPAAEQMQALRPLIEETPQQPAPGAKPITRAPTAPKTEQPIVMKSWDEVFDEYAPAPKTKAEVLTAWDQAKDYGLNDGLPTFTPKPGDVSDVPRHAVAGLEVVEVPVDKLKLSGDVPQFKKDADARGVVVPLGGKFDRTGVAPVQVWERENGDLEVISGRHRLDLAKRSGEETIPAQVYKEKDGFTAQQASTLDAILNIRDEQGSVADYANYFRSAQVTEEAANNGGLLARAKGRAGFTIARDASPDLFAAHRAGLLSDEAARQIAEASPGNATVQAVGLKLVNDGRPITQATNTMQAVLAMGRERSMQGAQGDIFGFDDAGLRQAEEMAKGAAAKQRELREQIAAVSGASKRPEIAKKFGVDVKDPEGIQKRIGELRQEQERWNNWSLYPDLVQQLRGEPTAPFVGNIPSMATDRGAGDNFTEYKPTQPAREVEELRSIARLRRSEAVGIENQLRNEYGKDENGYRTHLWPIDITKKMSSLYSEASILDKKATKIEDEIYENDDGRKERKEAFVKAIQESITTGKYTTYGIRVNSKNPKTGKEVKVSIGGKAKPSFYQPDGVSTNKKHGTSALVINDINNVEQVFNELKAYRRKGDDVVLLGSNKAKLGNDVGEVEMDDAVILGIYRDVIPKNIQRQEGAENLFGNSPTINLNIGITPGDVGRAAKRIAADIGKTDLGQKAGEAMGKIVDDIQMKAAPMAAGSDQARAVAKDYANAERLARWQWLRFDEILKKGYSAEERKLMWDAADEENLLRTEGTTDPERGLGRLNADQRATMDTLSDYGNQLLERAKAVGMFQGEGVKYWTPRVVAMIGEDGTISAPKAEGPFGTSKQGRNITTTAGSLKSRQHLTVEETEAAAKAKLGEGAQVVRDIRTMPMAMARIERAIAGRELINRIKEIGQQTGQELVSETEKPGFFTIDHPAFKNYRYRPDVVHAEGFDARMMEQLNKFAADIGITPETRLKMGGNVWGSASPTGQTLRKFGGPETVLTHELGHQLDFKYGLIDKMFGGKRPTSDFIIDRQIAKAKREGDAGRVRELETQQAINGEMRALADLRFEGKPAEDVSDYFKSYVRKGEEKMANMVHAYVHMPARFKQVAPQSFKRFQFFLDQHPELNRLQEIKPSLVLGSNKMAVRPPGEDFDVSPIYINKEFEGPLKAIMSDASGDLYKGFMALKGKTMGVIMYSPLIHNMVEWGRALPMMPGKVATGKIYFEGNAAKNDPEIMRRAIDNGLVPIGHRGGIQDITGILEDPNLQPGRSWTAKGIGGAVGLANKAAGEKVKGAIDTAGDVWHNTLLWDRVGDLQMGLFTNLERAAVEKGMQLDAAAKLAAHFANRYAGALPNESMSVAARKLANVTLFSRSFTLGNLGVMKDMLTGLPKDVQAQIERDAGTATREAAVSAGRKKAMQAFALDIALLYVGNSLLQSGLDAMKRDKSLSDIEKGYVDRYQRWVTKTREDPSELLNLSALTPMSENEPGKENRIRFDEDKQGTNIYMRLPTSKIGEEFQVWLTSPLDMIKRKEGTIARPLIQSFTNDKGFGRRVYDPDAPGFKGAAKAVGNIVWNILEQQIPMESIKSAKNVVSGQGDETDALKVIGPLLGVTFSKGAPGGAEVGVLFEAEKRHRGEVSEAMPEIKQLLKQGDTDKAMARMQEAHMTGAEQKLTLKYALEPKARISPTRLKKFYQFAPPEEQERMQRAGEH